MKILLFAALLFASKPFPEPPRDYVHNEGVVSADSERRLSEMLRGVEQLSHKQFVVALFRSLDGENLEEYSNKLFRHWKIGDAQRNDGLLYALFLDDRKWRVEVGYGLEGTLTDLQAAELGRLALPYFKRGDFAGGIETSVEALAAVLDGSRKAPPLRERRPPQVYRRQEEIPAGVVILMVLIFAGLIVLLSLFGGTRTYGRRRYYYSSGGWSSGGGGFSSGGGFSGGGGSSGGGGASGGW